MKLTLLQTKCSKQVEEFNKYVTLTGIILSKFVGASGGTLLSITNKTKLLLMA